MEREEHVHPIVAKGSFVRDHDHLLRGVTSGPKYLPNGAHVHLVSGTTTTDAYHRHACLGRTGSAYGGLRDHLHAFSCVTTGVHPPGHYYSGQTGRPMPGPRREPSSPRASGPAPQNPAAAKSQQAPTERPKGFLARLADGLKRFLGGN